ncbi:MAG: peptidoglycan DD-metalloendopeptidase family protein [Flavobacteriaceae bacterium]|nr:peptidoglycan DD-metalloendopeptidase family protein [Flavobacteriaceae bacterium]
MENKRKQLQKEIKEINSLLFKSKEEAETLLSDLDDITQKINVRSQLIRTINQEAEVLSKEISKNEKKIASQEKKLDILKKEYANMVVKSYKSKNKNSRLLFLLSSKNFLQAYKRLQYIKQYATYRKQQGEEIKATTVNLRVLTDSLQVKEDEKQLLIALHIKEKESVNREKISQEKLVTKVKAKEKKYITQIKRIQKEERKLDKKIQRLILEAIARSNRKSGNKKSTSFKLTPESKKLETSFIANKGKLPWPTKKGTVIRKYGKQKHPTLAGITIQSNGVQVATEKKAMARAIFDGTVLSIQLLPGRKKMVLVQHGNYITAYKNLDNVLVEKGEKVKTKQNIGTIHTDTTTGKTVLAFSLFKETKIQNPELWIGKML